MPANAQAPGIEWQKKVGSDSNTITVANALAVSLDSSYIIAGKTGKSPQYIYHFFIAKIDKDGNTKWQKIYGGTKGDVALAAQATPDNGCIVAGSSTSNDGDVGENHGKTDAWIIKLDSAGNIEWKKVYGTSDNEGISTLQLTQDGGYILAGDAFPFVWVLKLNHQGDIEWQNKYGSGGKENLAYDIKLTLDGGYIVAGSFTLSNANVDMWVMNVDSKGNWLWEKHFGKRYADNASTVQLTSDNGYILAGYSYVDNNGSHGGNDYCVVKLDSIGNQQWRKYFGGTNNDQINAIATTDDGSYLVAGYTASNDGDVIGFHGIEDGWIIKISSTGDLVWQKPFGGNSGDNIYSIKSIGNGKFVFAGLTGSVDGDAVGPLHGDFDAWVVKLSASTLPVSFSTFTAQKQKSNVLLQWQTATEQHSRQFNIQRSADGERFATIGSIPAAGNSSSLRSYTYNDAGALALNVPTLYYRIEEADNDGLKTYTKVITVAVGSGKPAFALLPNPVHHVINIHSNSAAKGSIRITDASGKIVYSGTATFTAGGVTSIPASQLAGGVYVVTVQGEGIKVSMKMVKE